MLRGDIESPSQLYHEIHSSFDARKDNKLDEAIISPYRTRSSSHQQSMHLNLGDNWSDSTPASIDSSNSARTSGNHHYVILMLKKPSNACLLDRARERVFLTHTTLTTIVDELEDVKTDLRVLASWEGTKIDSLRAQSELLRGFYTSVLQDPLSDTSIPAISSGWKAFEVQDLGERQISLLLRAQRSSIMLTNYLAWYWLDVYIPDACNSILDKGANFPTKWQWLVGLVQDVHQAYDLKSPRQQFSSSTYGILIPTHTATFQFVNTNRNAREGNALRAQVLNTVKEILQSWLGYPSTGQSRVQAWLVHVLLMEFGRRALYLNSVWKTYTGARRQSIDSQSWYLSSFKDVKPLQQAASKHPLSNPSSLESCALQELATLIDSFLEDGLEIDRQPEDSEEGTIGVPRLECLQERKVEIFAQFVKDCLSIFLNQNQSNSKLKNQIDRIPDKILPFREHAPSRLRFRGDDGPFSMEYSRTTEGAYSAVVWRGITFGTPFSIHNRMLFTSYQDFQLACQEAGEQEPIYFCDKVAYGTVNPSRNIGLAEYYWNTLSGGKWTDLVRDRIVPFMECYHFFTAGSCPPDFPQIGPLASYLITADFSYCRPKVVNDPKLSEMAFLMHSLNKGAVSALESLGFITPRARSGKVVAKGDLKEVEMAFGKVYELLKNIIIPAEHQEAINLDLIMTEHTLCKFSRAKHLNLIQQL